MVMDTNSLSSAVGNRVVNVTIPAEVAFDFDRFSKVQKDILGQLGCMACCSGFDIRWDFARQFYVDSKLNVRQGGVL
jgi:hypothetical protein